MLCKMSLLSLNNKKVLLFSNTPVFSIVSIDVKVRVSFNNMFLPTPLPLFGPRVLIVFKTGGNPNTQIMA